MGNGMNKVLPGLFLGNFIDAKDLDQLSRHNITHIISIHESPQPYIPGITYLRIGLADTPDAKIKKHFKECIHFIHSCRLRGGNCLVHCSPPPGPFERYQNIINPRIPWPADGSPPVSPHAFRRVYLLMHLAGISRSTTIVLAYVMAVTQLSWPEALEAVKKVRPVANPNPGFCQQLDEYESSRSIQKIRRKLERKYGPSPFNDEEEIRALLLPSGKRQELSRTDRTASQMAESRNRSAKHTSPFLLHVKQTFSCLPGCLK